MSQSVLSSSLLASATVAILFGLLACTKSDSTASSGGSPTAPDGGSSTADGGGPGEGGSGGDGAAPSRVNVTVETTPVLGVEREYILAVPKSYVSTRLYPLVLALHGDGFHGATFREFFTFDAVSGDDAIVAYPSGNSWDLSTPYDQNPDQQLVEAVITALKDKYSIDPTKVWAVGHSKGGFMANQVACRRPGLLKAMAFHASGAPQEPQGPNGFPQCPGVVGLPVLATEGQDDPTIGADYGASYWAFVNGCGGSRSATTPDSCVKYDGCPTDQPVVFCSVPGVKHFPIWSSAAAVSWGFFTAL